MEININELLNAESFTQHKHMKDLNVDEKHLALLSEKFQCILYYRHCKNLTFREIDELMNKRGIANDELRAYKKLRDIEIAENFPKNQIESLRAKLSPFKYKLLNETFKNNNLSNLDDFVDKFTTYKDIKSINEFGNHAIETLLEAMSNNGYTEWVNKIRISNIPVVVDDSVSELSISEMIDELIVEIPTIICGGTEQTIYEFTRSDFEYLAKRNERWIEVLYYRKCRKLSLKKVANIFSISPERIRQIEAKTFRIFLKIGKSRSTEGLIDSLDHIEDMATRAYNCIRRAGVTTINDLITMFPTYEKLLGIRNLGESSIENVLDVMSRSGYEHWVNQINVSKC